MLTFGSMMQIYNNRYLIVLVSLYIYYLCSSSRGTMQTAAVELEPSEKQDLNKMI